MTTIFKVFVIDFTNASTRRSEQYHIFKQQQKKQAWGFYIQTS